MSVTKIRALTALVIGGACFLGLRWLMAAVVLPDMIVAGNRHMMQHLIPPLTAYCADHGKWPTGTPNEIFMRLIGFNEEQIAEALRNQAIMAQQAARTASSGEEEDEGDGNSGNEEESAAVNEEAIAVTHNYLSRLPLKVIRHELADSWGHSLVFSFPEGQGGPVKITSLGPDAALGTADDQSVSVEPVPRAYLPDRRFFLARQRFDAINEAKRLERARRAELRAAAQKK